MKPWAKELLVWLHDPTNRNQDIEKKSGFVRTAKVGDVTQLQVLGIDNGSLKKKARSLSKEISELGLEELLPDLDSIFTNAEHIEERVIVCFILERFRREFDQSLFQLLDEKWIALIDHWIVNDHLSLNVIGHFPVYEEPYYSIIAQYPTSRNFWRRRMALTAFILQIRKKKEATARFLPIVKRLLGDKNYYVKKAVPWTLREASKSDPESVTEFLRRHKSQMNRTTLKEASARLSEDVRQEMLAQ